MTNKPLISSQLPFPCRSGKVRDVYDMGDSLLIVSTDRISAFDWILPTGIPGKGQVLTQLSCFWFSRLNVQHHLISCDVPKDLDLSDETKEELVGRSMHTKKADVIPFECVVRGYLEGSGWREYSTTGKVCGIRLPSGLQQCDKLPEPIFTPATKAEGGHDENVSFEFMANELGEALAQQLRSQSLDVYLQGSNWARERGIIIADTKFEWGRHEGEVILIDEVLTPDSSRFWPADEYQPGGAQKSFDKQFVREWLMESDWDRDSEPPPLPVDVVKRTSQKYRKAYSLLTGEELGE